VALTSATIFVLRRWATSRVPSSTVRANHLTERPNIMLQNPWHALSGNPGLAGTILLVSFIGVMAWAGGLLVSCFRSSLWPLTFVSSRAG
jgi:hypothetical protein